MAAYLTGHGGIEEGCSSKLIACWDPLREVDSEDLGDVCVAALHGMVERGGEGGIRIGGRLRNHACNHGVQVFRK